MQLVQVHTSSSQASSKMSTASKATSSSTSYSYRYIKEGVPGSTGMWQTEADFVMIMKSLYTQKYSIYVLTVLTLNPIFRIIKSFYYIIKLLMFVKIAV